MHFQFEVSTPAAAQSVTAGSAPAPGETADLLRQLLEVQREQLQLQRNSALAHDASGRWKAFLSRWRDDYAELPSTCKEVLPLLERAYIALIADLAGSLRQEGDDSLDSEFALSEFLDRYGMRLGQLGAILSLVGPLAELAPAAEEPKST